MGKRITVVGTGNVGCTLAADLIRKGHSVSLLKTSRSLHEDNFAQIRKTGIIEIDDPYIVQYQSRITSLFELDYEGAVRNADVIILATQTNYHEGIITKISPFLRDGQVIVFEPGYLSSCFLLKHCDKDIVSIEAESSPIDCRIMSPGRIKVLFKNVLNPFGVYPLSKLADARSVLESLGYPFRFTENVFEAALHNPNLIVHTVGALFSIPRIEYTKGEYWMYREVFTPHVWNVCEALDQEKLAVLEGLGIHDSQRYVEACQERNYVDDPREPLESFFDYANNSSPKGPSIPDSRYLTEDTSQGLVMLESLGRYLNVETPVASSLISLACASLQVDLREKGRTIEKLGIENLDRIKDDYHRLSRPSRPLP